MKAKKSLGQNFLKSGPALKKIIQAGEVGKGDTILEIGPGRGALTEKLLESGSKVIAVEKDRELVELLHEKFSKQTSDHTLVLIHEDILNFDPKKFNLKPGAYKLIANIPYNITGAIIKKFLSEETQPKRMVLMVQHEVAQRIMARDGKESLLSIGVKAYGTPKLVMKVPKRYFSPEPRVNSAIISIEKISKNVFEKNKVDEERFWTLVRLGFAHKRKILAKNLKTLEGKVGWGTILEQIGLQKSSRAEELSIKDWLKLAQETNPH